MAEKSEDGQPKSASNAAKVFFLAGVTLISLCGGFGLNIALAGGRYRRGYKSMQEGYEDPVLLATRALGWGTLYAVGGVGTVAVTVGCVWKL